MTEASIILFEPICRGSRLQILANTISAIRTVSSRHIKVVTRKDYLTPHVTELLGTHLAGVQFVCGNTNLGGAWIKTLDGQELRCMLEALSQAAQGEPDADIVFMALDDYTRPFASEAGWVRARFVTQRIFVLKYRVEYMLAKADAGWRGHLLNILTRWTLRRIRAGLICFDERFSGSHIAGKQVVVIPDPWFGDFSPQRRHAARLMHGFNDEQSVVLTLGRQDRRKGFPLLQDILPQLLADTVTRLFVVGAIDGEFRAAFEASKVRFGERIVHIDRFIDEAELADVFACADVFLLPYARAFTATSGTLPRAAASGVPVVSGRHGLVGHRIRKRGLGNVFDIDSAAGLLDAIRAVQSYPASRKAAASSALAAFADSARLDSFERVVGATFAPIKKKDSL